MSVYNFSGIFDEKIYSTGRLVMVVGKYSVFSNIVCDKLRALSKGSGEHQVVENEIFEEFGGQEHSVGISTSGLGFDMFMDVAITPPLFGKWYCCVELSELTPRQKTRLDKYMKKPSEYGCLVVRSSEFKDYSKYIKDKTLRGSQVAHLIQLSFPSRKALSEVVDMMFERYGYSVTPDASKLFILRMSDAYDDYEQQIERVVELSASKNVTIQTMKEALRGVENFVLDDFIKQLTVAVKSTKMAPNRKINKMLKAMVEEYGAIGLVKKLRYKINDAIEMRMIINSGVVPVRIRYSVSEAKSRLPDENKLKKLNDYSFKRLAQVAALTSLRDWIYMLMILNTPELAYSEEQHTRALFSLINRGAYSDTRLMNVIGVQDILSERRGDLLRFGLGSAGRPQ